jgi:hypothetical protein
MISKELRRAITELNRLYGPPATAQLIIYYYFQDQDYAEGDLSNTTTQFLLKLHHRLRRQDINNSELKFIINKAFSYYREPVYDLNLQIMATMIPEPQELDPNFDYPQFDQPTNYFQLCNWSGKDITEPVWTNNYMLYLYNLNKGVNISFASLYDSDFPVQPKDTELLNRISRLYLDSHDYHRPILPYLYQYYTTYFGVPFAKQYVQSILQYIDYDWVWGITPFIWPYTDQFFGLQELNTIAKSYDLVVAQHFILYDEKCSGINLSPYTNGAKYNHQQFMSMFQDYMTSDNDIITKFLLLFQASCSLRSQGWTWGINCPLKQYIYRQNGKRVYYIRGADEINSEWRTKEVDTWLADHCRHPLWADSLIMMDIIISDQYNAEIKNLDLLQM